VKSYPGESIRSSCIAIVAALIFPSSGISRGLGAIVRFGGFRRNRLVTAARSGALCTVVRNASWRFAESQTATVLHALLCSSEQEQRSSSNERPGSSSHSQEIFNDDKDVYDKVGTKDMLLEFGVWWPPWLTDQSKLWYFPNTAVGIVDDTVKINGFYNLTSGYVLAHVPRDAKVVPGIQSKPDDWDRTTIHPNYSSLKALIALGQFFYAVITLYRALGPQIDRYGFVAPGLTVAPYAVMTLINLIGNILTPDYEALYMVGSDIMDEAMSRGSSFDGVVGRLITDPHPKAGFVDARMLTPERAAVRLSGRTSVTREVSYTSSAGTDSSSPTSEEKHQRCINKVHALMNSLQWWFTSERAAFSSSFYPKPRGQTLLIPACPAFFTTTESCRNNYHITKYDPSQSQYIRTRSSNHQARNTVYLASLAVSCTSIALVGILSHYQPRSATPFQRVVVLNWIGFGMTSGPIVWSAERFLLHPPLLQNFTVWHAAALLVMMGYFVPALMGFWSVGDMLVQLGECVLLY